MLIFSTQLYIRQELTNDMFIQQAIKWVSGGPNYSFGKIEWDRSEEFLIENEVGDQKFSIIQYEDAVIVHLINKNDNVIWTNDYVLTQKGGRRILAVQLHNDVEDMSVKIPNEFNRPKLLKTIVAEGYGDLDNGLETSEKAHLMDMSDIVFAKNIILGREAYFMPIVYVTPELHTSSFDLDFVELAKDLAGVAHVIVEPSSEFTRQLKELTNGANPYDGAVQIFYPNNGTQRVLPKFFSNRHAFRKEVAYAVFRKLILRKIDDAFLWSKIRYDHLMEKSKESFELSSVCDELLDEKDKLIEANNQRIQELEEANNQLKNKLLIYESRFKKQNKENAQIISLNVQEEDLYEDEIKDVILRALKNEYQSMDLDPNQKESRKYHVLKSIIQQNKQSGRADEIKNALKDILNSDGSFNRAKRKQLSDLGFEVEEGKHYKIKFMGDGRYTLTLSKTSSDYKSNKNAVTVISNKLFGY